MPVLGHLRTEFAAMHGRGIMIPYELLILGPRGRMKRREFITLLGGAAVTWPLTARGQQRERMHRIGVLLPTAADDAVY
jgi:hypothetical protein